MNDIHISKENIDQFKLNWKEALDLTISNSVNHVIIGGDLFTSRHSQTLDVLLAVFDALQECQDNNITVTILEGNHDKVDPESDRGYCSVFQSFDNVTVVKDWMLLDLNGVRVGLISYFLENGSFMDMLNGITEELNTQEDAPNILYIHQGIKGGLTQPSDNELPTSVFTNWDKVLVGHYHDRKVIEGTNIEYIGASRQHGFGEDEEKGYTLLFNDGSTQFLKNEINVKYLTIEKDFEELSDYRLVDEVRKLLNKNYKVRIKVYCDDSQASKINKAALFDMGVTKIEAVSSQKATKVASKESINERYDKDGIIEAYKRFCEKNDVKNVDFGVKYLKAIN